MSGLRVDESTGREPLPASRQEPRPRLIIERGIEKDDIEGSRLGCHERLRVLRVRFERVDPQQFARGAQSVDQSAVAVDGNRERSATRCRLERQRAGACIKVETALPGQVLSEPVEKRLANAVGRRTQTFAVRKSDLPAAPGTADNTNAISRSGHRIGARVASLKTRIMPRGYAAPG